jgi:hypothetical protein
MLTNQLFETVSNINDPWFIKDIQFDPYKKRYCQFFCVNFS